MFDDVSMRELRAMERQLKMIADVAQPIAVQRTINTSAFTTMRNARGGLKRDRVVRTPFTTKSIRVEPERGLHVDSMESTVGSVAGYMAKLELGETKISKGSEGTPLATSVASGEGRGVQPRRRLPRRQNKLRNITFGRPTERRTARRPKQVYVFKVQNAVATGNRFFYHDFGNRKGIMKVTGGDKKRAYYRGFPKGARVDMHYDLTHKVLSVPKYPWLRPEFEKAAKKLPDIYAREMNKQFKRHRSVFALR